jgi:hypothetical protein
MEERSSNVRESPARSRLGLLGRHGGEYGPPIVLHADDRPASLLCGVQGFVQVPDPRGTVVRVLAARVVSVPVLPSLAVLVTGNMERSWRSSSATSTASNRRRPRFRPRPFDAPSDKSPAANQDGKTRSR